MATDAMTLINQAEGKSLTKVARNGLGGYLLALATSAISGTQQIFDLLILPLEMLMSVGREAVDGLILAQIGVVEAGAQTTASELGAFGFLAQPAGVALTLGTFLIIAYYLRREETSDLVPGIFIDPPIPFVGVQEDDGDDD